MFKILIIITITIGVFLPGSSRAGTGDIYTLLESTVPSVRRTAVGEISATRDTGWIDTLGDLLSSDPHFSVRAGAAEALGILRSSEATPYLVAALEDENRNVKASAIVSLGYIRDTDSVEPLMNFVREEENLGLVVSALNVLGVLGSSEALPLLEESLGSEEARVRQVAVQSLGRLRSSDSADAITALLDDPERNVRLQAIRALGEIGNPSAVRPLRREIRRLDDTELKLAAAYSLGQLGNDDGYDTALEAARTGTGPERISGLNALSVIGEKTPEAESAVRDAYASGDPAVRRAAEYAASILEIDIEGARP